MVNSHWQLKSSTREWQPDSLISDDEKYLEYYKLEGKKFLNVFQKLYLHIIRWWATNSVFIFWYDYHWIYFLNINHKYQDSIPASPSPLLALGFRLLKSLAKSIAVVPCLQSAGSALWLPCYYPLEAAAASFRKVEKALHTLGFGPFPNKTFNAILPYMAPQTAPFSPATLDHMEDGH